MPRVHPGASVICQAYSPEFHLLLFGFRTEGSVECRVGGVERDSTHELDRLGRAEQAVHARVLPLDRDGPLIADRVEHAERILPGHVAMPRGDEVPATARVCPGEVRAEAAVAAVDHALAGVLAVDVVDALAEVPEEA